MYFKRSIRNPGPGDEGMRRLEDAAVKLFGGGKDETHPDDAADRELARKVFAPTPWQAEDIAIVQRGIDAALAPETNERK